LFPESFPRKDAKAQRNTPEGEGLSFAPLREKLLLRCAWHRKFIRLKFWIA
jgi:hypothetical protein